MPACPSVLVMLIAAWMSPRPPAGTDDRSILGPATPEEVARLVQELGDPDYETRVFATRRLCAIGPPASEKLLAAVDGPDTEAALRARKLLTTLDRVLLRDVDVSLSFTRTEIAWAEPVDLLLTLTNRSAYAARIPFEIRRADRSADDSDARQVAAMLDVSEWLRVRNAEGREIELRVDDIAADAEVLAAVQDRLNGGPVETLAPGERVQVLARALNRGWARYPLLDRGEYTVAFEYLPPWEDDALATARVGRVASDPVTITVNGGAPPGVSRSGLEAEIELTTAGRDLVVRLANRSDQLLHINTNLGGAPPFAEGRWVYERDGMRRELPAGNRGAASFRDFQEARLVALDPGGSLEIERAAIADLRQALAAAGADLSGQHWTVVYSYTNRCDRRWQERQAAMLTNAATVPEVLRRPLPRRMLSGRLNSNELTAPAAD